MSFASSRIFLVGSKTGHNILTTVPISKGGENGFRRLGQRTFYTDHKPSTDTASPGLVRGIDRLRDPKLNKGMGFTLEERQKLGIHGLLPPIFKTLEEQVALCKMNFERYSENLNKYIYLVELMERNEKVFYRLLTENVEEMMPIVYTPTVGLACQKFGLIYRRPQGLFITIHDKGHVHEILENWPETDVRAIVVTDGERILGLGDLGAYGMGIPVGKLALYTALAGIRPSQCLPIVLDVGTNSQYLLEDPLYIGLKHARIQGQQYDELLDEFMWAVTQKYGQDVLVQFEDFGNKNAFRLLDKYRNKYCTFNDDIQGTAAMVLAGLLASLRITKKKLSDNVIFFYGAGGAALGIAELLVMAIITETGISPEEAKKKIWLADSKGLMVHGRCDIPSMTPLKRSFLKSGKLIKDIDEMMTLIKPTILIGACTVGGVFTPKVIKYMAEINERPIIFALSNPTSNAECTAEEAYKHTNGTAIFASGSPFPEFFYEGKKFTPGQGNNAYIFPGVALGILASGIHHVGEDIFLLAAQTLADLVQEDDLETGRLYPHLSTIHNCSVAIATKIAEYAYDKDLATTYPEPSDKEAFIRAQLYDLNYGPAVSKGYAWPEGLTI